MPGGLLQGRAWGGPALVPRPWASLDPLGRAASSSLGGQLSPLAVTMAFLPSLPPAAPRSPQPPCDLPWGLAAARGRCRPPQRCRELCGPCGRPHSAAHSRFHGGSGSAAAAPTGDAGPSLSLPRTWERALRQAREAEPLCGGRASLSYAAQTVGTAEHVPHQAHVCERAPTPLIRRPLYGKRT